LVCIKSCNVLAKFGLSIGDYHVLWLLEALVNKIPLA